MIYEPLVRTGYECVNTVDQRDHEVFWSFNGTPRAKTWVPIRVKRVRADDRQEFRASDFPWLGTYALILRDRAVQALRHVIEPFAEFLPLRTDDGVALTVLNVLSVVDALDEARSKVLRFPSTGNTMSVTRPYFRDSVIAGLDLFRLPFRAAPTYVSQRFVDATAAADLVGLEFRYRYPPR